MKSVSIFASSTSSIGGMPPAWGAVLENNGRIKHFSGAAAVATNESIGLTAVIQALSLLKEPCKVDITTSSPDVAECFNNHIDAWKKKSWCRPSGSPILHANLWMALDKFRAEHIITIRHLPTTNGGTLLCEAHALAIRHQVPNPNDSVPKAITTTAQTLPLTNYP